MTLHKDSKPLPDKDPEEQKLEEQDEIAKRASAKYSEETCTVCGSRFDEYGYCACGAGGN